MATMNRGMAIPTDPKLSRGLRPILSTMKKDRVTPTLINMKEMERGERREFGWSGDAV